VHSIRVNAHLIRLALENPPACAICSSSLFAVLVRSLCSFDPDLPNVASRRHSDFSGIRSRLRTIMAPCSARIGNEEIVAQMFGNPDFKRAFT
jgi:hypothetical protein